MSEIIFFADIVITTIAIVWLIAACITDIKKREVADWVSFSLITISLYVRFIAAILSSNYSYFFYSLAGLAIFVLIAFIFYYARIFGGGDAKLLMALGVSFSSKPLFVNEIIKFGLFENYPEPFLFTFIINLFFLGSIYGFIFSLSLAIKNRKKFIEIYKEKIKEERIFPYLIIFLVIFTFSLFLKVRGLFFLSMLVLIFPYLLTFVKSAEQLMIKRKSWRELTEGDWLSKEIKINKNKIIKPTAEGLTKQDILMIKKYKKKVPILEGIPFVPIILLSLLFSLFFGDILIYLLQFTI